MQSFASLSQLLDVFATGRLDAYGRRLVHQQRALMRDRIEVENKIRFVSALASGAIRPLEYANVSAWWLALAREEYVHESDVSFVRAPKLIASEDGLAALPSAKEGTILN